MVAPLLDDVRAFIRRYVVLSDDQSAAAALWVLHTYAITAAEATPYLHITARQKECGKTRLLETLSLLVASPWLTGRCTAAVLVRKMDRDRPTLLLDETDAAFGGEKEYAETLRGVLNAGYLRGGVASLCVKQGKDFELRDFSVFGAKAFAGIGKLPDTVASRSIKIELFRKTDTEKVKRFRRRDAAKDAVKIAEQIEAWAADANLIARLADARPSLPDELSDRAQDVWEPLLAIADLAGPEWATCARSAAVALSGREAVEDDDNTVQLLTDIRNIFAERNVEKIASSDLANAIAKREDGFLELAVPAAFDARRLAALLRPLGIRPGGVRIGDRTPKGYDKQQFANVWHRYLPSHVHPPNDRNNRNIGNNSDFTGDSSTNGTATSSATDPQSSATPSEADAGGGWWQAYADALQPASATLRTLVHEKPLYDGRVAAVADVAVLRDEEAELCL